MSPALVFTLLLADSAFLFTSLMGQWAQVSPGIGRTAYHESSLTDISSPLSDQTDLVSSVNRAIPENRSGRDIGAFAATLGRICDNNVTFGLLS